MAYLILEDDETGNAGAYLEFDPENGTTLDKIESLLALRRSIKGAAVGQLDELAGESLQQQCNCPKQSGATALLSSIARLFSIRNPVKQPAACRCENRRTTSGLSGRISPEPLSMTS